MTKLCNTTNAAPEKHAQPLLCIAYTLAVRLHISHGDIKVILVLAHGSVEGACETKMYKMAECVCVEVFSQVYRQ